MIRNSTISLPTYKVTKKFTGLSFKNQSVWYNKELEVTFRCKMRFHDFPMDRQARSFTFLSEILGADIKISQI